MVRSVTWPHKVVYCDNAQPVVYEHISTMAFCDGYITVISKESSHIKALMLSHLQELMEDGECYWWPAVKTYHAAWLQHIKQGWAAWGDMEKKMKLCWALIWHLVEPSFKTSATPSQRPSQQAPEDPTNPTRRAAILSEPFPPGDKACVNVNYLPSNADHPSLLHVCNYCIYSVQCLYHNTEQFYRRKALSKH